MWFNTVKCLTLKIDGTDLDCVRFGSGEKTLVMIPGLGIQGVKSAAFGLAYMYRIFTKEYTVYVFDKKAVIPHGYTIRNLAGDLASAMAQLDLKNADIFGVSQGGMIAQYLAIDYPELVNKAVLGITSSRCNDVISDVVGRWIEMAKQNDYRAFVVDMFEKMYSAAYLKKYKWLLPIASRIGKPKDFSRFIALAESCLTCNAYPELDKITCPVFVIGGKQDLVVTGGESEEIAARLGCEIYMYENLGHAAYDEASDFSERVYRFLKG